MDSTVPAVRSSPPSTHFSVSVTLSASCTVPVQACCSVTSTALPDATDRTTALPPVFPAQPPSSAAAFVSDPLSSPDDPPGCSEAVEPLGASLFSLSLPQPVSAAAERIPAAITTPVRTGLCICNSPLLTKDRAKLSAGSAGMERSARGRRSRNGVPCVCPYGVKL